MLYRKNEILLKNWLKSEKKAIFVVMSILIPRICCNLHISISSDRFRRFVKRAGEQQSAADGAPAHAAQDRCQ